MDNSFLQIDLLRSVRERDSFTGSIESRGLSWSRKLLGEVILNNKLREDHLHKPDCEETARTNMVPIPESFGFQPGIARGIGTYERL